VTGYTYDTGALLAAEARAAHLWLLHRDVLSRRVKPVVPAGALAQAWRGGGGAMARGDVVVTSGPDDLIEIAHALGGKLLMRVV
jgi:hypothetical protein